MENLQVNQENQEQENQNQNNEEVNTDNGTVEQNISIDEDRGIVTTQDGTEMTKEEYDNMNGTNLSNKEEEFSMPDKFEGKSAEEIAKAYMELEKMKKNSEPEKKEYDENSKKEEKTEDNKKETSEYLNDVVTKYISNGEVSEEDVKKLNDMGYSNDQIEIYKDGIVAQQEKATTDFLRTCDTNMDEYSKVLDWMTSSKSEDEIEEYNKLIIDAGDNTNLLKNIIGSAVKDYKSSNSQNQEQPKQYNLHSNNSRIGVEGYKTKSEMYKDINDPRYRNDPSFRKVVEDKQLKSNF